MKGAGAVIPCADSGVQVPDRLAPTATASALAADLRAAATGRLVAALAALAIVAAVLTAAAGAARAQDTFPGTILLADETPDAWQGPVSISELNVVVLRGPLGVTEPDSCAVLQDLGVPEFAIELATSETEPSRIIFSFRALEAPIDECPEDNVEGPFAGAEIRPGGLPAGTWELDYIPPEDVPLPDGVPLQFEVTKTPLSGLASRVRRLTRSAGDDFELAVGGAYLVWIENRPLEGPRILRSLAGGTPEAVPGGDNVAPSFSFPQVSPSGLVAWAAPAPGAQVENDFEVFVSDPDTDTEAVQLTNDGRRDRDLQISDSFLVWVSRDEDRPDESAEIFYADLSQPAGEMTPIQLTSTGSSHGNPRISGSLVVWEGFDGEDFDIYFADLSAGSIAVRKIADPDGALDQSPRIDGTRAVWERRDPNGLLPEEGDPDLELFTADLSEPEPAPVAVTNNTVEDQEAFLQGDQVVWRSQAEGEDFEIFLADLSGGAPFTLQRITDNDVQDARPRLLGPDRILWQIPDAALDQLGTGEVMTADAGAVDPIPTLRVTDDLLEDADLESSDEVAAWVGLAESDGDLSANFEIFLLPEPPPAVLRLTAAATLALAWSARSRLQRRGRGRGR